MARRVFFSFHFQRDAIRVSQIRQCNSITNHFEESPFIPASDWETIKRNGPVAIRNWIDNQMHYCGVVVLLAGYETSSREWVKYELEKAHREKKGIVCIDLSGMRNMQGHVDPQGINPLQTAFDASGRSLYSLNKYKTYSWEYNNGRYNVDEWIEEAARNARLLAHCFNQPP
jgi:hypothetical protein